MTKMCDKYCEIVNNSIFKQRMAKHSKLSIIWTSFDLVGETTISWNVVYKASKEEYLDFVLETAHYVQSNSRFSKIACFNPVRQVTPGSTFTFDLLIKLCALQLLKAVCKHLLCYQSQ